MGLTLVQGRNGNPSLLQGWSGNKSHRRSRNTSVTYSTTTSRLQSLPQSVVEKYFTRDVFAPGQDPRSSGPASGVGPSPAHHHLNDLASASPFRTGLSDGHPPPHIPGSAFPGPVFPTDTRYRTSPVTLLGRSFRRVSATAPSALRSTPRTALRSVNTYHRNWEEVTPTLTVLYASSMSLGRVDVQPE